MKEKKYLIIGAGGTGGVIGAYMAQAGKDVTLIARGAHLRALAENGLRLERMWKNDSLNISIRACTEEEYLGSGARADVIFVCVKSYSLAEVLPLIGRAAHCDTVVIPILNVYGTGGKLQEELSALTVTDGCIYVSANIKEPGVIAQHGKICRLLFGRRDHRTDDRRLQAVRDDLQASGIDGIYTDNIQREALKKFSYVSPAGAAGLYCDATAGDFQQEGPAREMFIAMVREIEALAGAMGIDLGEDMVEANLRIMKGLPPETTTSMQRDVYQGRQSEADGLVYEVVRLGHRYGVPVPAYEKAAARLRERTDQ